MKANQGELDKVADELRQQAPELSFKDAHLHEVIGAVDVDYFAAVMKSNSGYDENAVNFSMSVIEVRLKPKLVKPTNNKILAKTIGVKSEALFWNLVGKFQGFAHGRRVYGKIYIMINNREGNSQMGLDFAGKAVHEALSMHYGSLSCGKLNERSLPMRSAVVDEDCVGGSTPQPVENVASFVRHLRHCLRRRKEFKSARVVVEAYGFKGTFRTELEDGLLTSKDLGISVEKQVFGLKNMFYQCVLSIFGLKVDEEHQTCTNEPNFGLALAAHTCRRRVVIGVGTELFLPGRVLAYRDPSVDYLGVTGYSGKLPCEADLCICSCPVGSSHSIICHIPLELCILYVRLGCVDTGTCICER